MYLHGLSVSVALLTGFLFRSIFAEGLTLAEDNGFHYVYAIVESVPGLHRGDPISSFTLARYAAQAYRQMISMPELRAIGYPEAMSALWLPNDRQIILSSSARGGPGFAYHPGNIPMALQIELAAAAAVGQSQKGWVTDIHNKGGACGEIVALSTYYYYHPTRDRVAQLNAKFVTVTQRSVVNGPIMVANACEGTDNGPGCRDFLAELGLAWCGTNEVSGPLKRRTALGLGNVVGRRQNDMGGDIDFTDFKFVCHPGMPLPDNATVADHVSPEVESSTSIEIPGATPTQSLGPDSPDAHINIIAGTAIDDKSITVTTLVPLVSPLPQPDLLNPQKAPGSGNPGGNAPENSPHNPADGSGTNTNPQDPYANSGPGDVNPPKLFARWLSRGFGRLFR